MCDERHPFEDAVIQILARELEPGSKKEHPRLETLIDRMTGGLSQEDAESVDVHCTLCKDCSSRMEVLQNRLTEAEVSLGDLSPDCTSFTRLYSNGDRRVISRPRLGWRRMAIAALAAASSVAVLVFSVVGLIQQRTAPLLRGGVSATPQEALYLLLGFGGLVLLLTLCTVLWRRRGR